MNMYSSDDRKVMQNSDKNDPIVPQQPRLREYKWWFRVSLYIIFLLAGQSSALLLERLYYDKGGNSKWMVAFVQSAGFPLLLPLMICSSNAKFTNNMLIINDDSSKTKPKVSTLVSLYLVFGLILAGDNFMYSYGILYLPLSTFCLLCATELAFNALFAFFLNSQKFTPLIFNSIVLLTISASLLAINSDSDDSLMVNLPPRRETIVLGFFFTLGACAIFSLYLCLVQLCFERVIKSETFSAVLDMQFYPCIIATCACVVGLFASGEWKTLDEDMKGYENGKVSYIMTLLWIAVTWQICYIGMLGLVFDVSSLFSNVIGTLVTSIVPILAVVFFRDNINGVKFIALVLSVWGFLSYIYQHYLDDKKAKDDKSLSIEVSKGEVQVC